MRSAAALLLALSAGCDCEGRVGGAPDAAPGARPDAFVPHDASCADAEAGETCAVAGDFACIDETVVRYTSVPAVGSPSCGEMCEQELLGACMPGRRCVLVHPKMMPLCLLPDAGPADAPADAPPDGAPDGAAPDGG